MYDEMRLCVATYQSGGEGHGNTQIYDETDRYMYLIGYTGKPLVIDTTNPIRLEFSWTRIQSYIMMGKVI